MKPKKQRIAQLHSNCGYKITGPYIHAIIEDRPIITLYILNSQWSWATSLTTVVDGSQVQFLWLMHSVTTCLQPKLINLTCTPSMSRAQVNLKSRFRYSHPVSEYENSKQTRHSQWRDMRTRSCNNRKTVCKVVFGFMTTYTEQSYPSAPFPITHRSDRSVTWWLYSLLGTHGTKQAHPTYQTG